METPVSNEANKAQKTPWEDTLVIEPYTTEDQVLYDVPLRTEVSEKLLDGSNLGSLDTIGQKVTVSVPSPSTS